MRTVSLIALALLAVAAVACGGGGASSSSPTAVDSTSADIDPNLLTTVALQPADVPPGYVMAQGFSPGATAGTRAFARTFQQSGVSIISSVAQYPDRKARDAAIDHLRSGLTKFIGKETTFILPGSDASFEYVGTSPPAQGTLMLLGRYIVSVTYSAQSLDQAAAVSDRTELERVSKVVFGRLQALIANPSATTPAAGAPTFDARPSATPSQP